MDDTDVGAEERHSARLEACGGRAAVEAAGAQLLPLIGWRWVHRRVEAISFEDDSTVRREVTITFTVPRSSTREQPLLLPLTLMGKESVTGFDFVDEGGTMLPLLTACEKGTMASGLLVGLLRKVMHDAGEAVPNEVIAAVRAVAECDGHEGRQRVRDFWASCPAPVAVVLREGESPMAESFRGLLPQLALHHLVIVPLECAAGDRRVLRFSYCEPADPADPAGREQGWRPPTWELVKRTIGWEPKRYRFRAPGMGQGGTYHFSITVPDGVKITQLRLLSTRVVEGRPEPVVLADAAVGPGATKHVFTRDGYPGRYGNAAVALRARGSSIVRAAALNASAVALMLLVGLAVFPDLVGQTSADREIAASLLLLLPTLAGVYVVNSGEHRLASSLVYGVRLLTLVSASTTFAATGILVLGSGTMGWWFAWFGATVVAVVIATVLLRTMYLTWRRGREARDMALRRMRAAWRFLRPLADA